MSRNTFTKILSNIHLADNTKISSKTYKVDEFLNILLKNFKKNYNLGENVSIDEKLRDVVHWNNIFHWNQQSVGSRFGL